MARTLDGAIDRAPLAFGQGAVVMGASVLDRKQFAVAVEDRDRLTVVLDDPALAGPQFACRAYGDLVFFVADYV